MTPHWIIAAVIVACWRLGTVATHVQLLVVGGTGNLAEKYIWPALNELQQRHTMAVWAAGTDTPADAAPRLASIVPDSLSISYAQLARAEDYEALSRRPEWTIDSTAGLIVYLAIPPKFFAQVSSKHAPEIYDAT
uniref:Secreted protein n=1 Tax=Achlya hypogyna TaxID=1202772 RepID=A0A0A7CPA9_ACHHY|nr:secreted protein [Achlya hypogyna]